MDTSNPNTGPDDEPSMNLLIEGDLDAWEKIDSLYHGRIRAFFRSKEFLAGAEPEDLAQDTFLRAFEFRHTIKAKFKTVFPWLIIIARNQFADLCRKQGKLPLKFNSELVVESVVEVNSSLLDGPELDALQLAMQQLPLECQRVIKWALVPRSRRKNRLSDFASSEGISVSGASKRLRKCTEHLKRIFHRILDATDE